MLLRLGVALLVVHLTAAVLDDRPRIKCESGHLRLEGGDGKNISLLTRGSGAVVVNGVDIATSLSLVWSVRGQLQSLNNTNLGYLVQNLSQVAQTVASQTWISTSIRGLNSTVTTNRHDVTQLRSDVREIRTTLEPLQVNVSRLSSLASLTTPEGTQRVQNLLTRLDQLQQASTTDLQRIQDLSDQVVPDLRQRIEGLQAQVAGLPDLEDRVDALETRLNDTFSEGSGALSASFMRTFRRLRRDVRRIKTLLTTDECASGPCQHGGTCIDGYQRYTCICPKGWQGEDCSDDFDECYDFYGTGLGCQNGATCTNTPGGYRCTCANGWYGIHCTERSSNCSSSSGSGLCGEHGTCIPSPRGQFAYSCICDEGWKPGTTNPSCVDVDECTDFRPRCSHDPPVQCVNYPGGFSCGPCPQGYTGNGFYCNDINECLFNNGGCSPFSMCENTRGSRRCGPCASGYTGDGVTCMPAPNPCLNNPCHPLATCSYNPQMSSSFYQCICPPGYHGNGIGFNGCIGGGQSGGGTSGGGQVQPTNWCLNNPCLNGATCTQFQGSFTYTCICQPGYTGRNCEMDIDECASQPCLNGGTCTQGLNSFTCTCPSTHTGNRCQTENQECGGRLTGTSGAVSYPGIHGQPYNHNARCTWVIEVPRDKVLNVTFSYFHLEDNGCIFDWLEVRDGRGSNARQIGRYCGSSLPGRNGTIISTYNTLYLLFRSDHSTAGMGFNFTWNATDPVCGGSISGRTYGSINSPGYPGMYPSDRDCHWTIRVSPGKRIRFHFATLQIEHHPNCSYDFLEVRDGLTETAHSLGKYCSTQAPAPLTTSGAEAFIHFHTDNSLTDTGFHISFSAEPGIPGCGGVLTSDMGEFSPPTQSDLYEHNQHCEWQIRVPPGETVTLNFTEFHLESHHSCRWDYVEIRDGGDADSPLIRRACGLDIPEPIQSSSNQLFVVFHSDHSISRRGFRASYQVACGGEFTGSTGLLRSPYHPQSYPHNRECIYIIRQPVGKAIKLNFTDFDIEGPTYWSGCVFDYVEVRDGRRATSGLLGRHCGPPTHRPPPIISTLNYMWIKFRTDASVSNRGFIANYTTIDTICGGVHRELSGHINSPNSPDTYPGNTDCYWVLDLPPGYVIQLTWHTFSLEDHYNCNYDYVEIFDNSSIPGNGGRMGERYCGNNMPPIMTSSDNLVTIHFHADHSVNHDGFSAIYHGLDASRMCGGNYHTQSGIIFSPNYPNNYPVSRTCKWTITVPRAHQIKLAFDEVFIEPSVNCVYDVLEIRNGGSATSPLITKICSRNETVPDIFSHHHQLYIEFKTDESYSEKGFKIYWDSAATGCGGTLTAVSGEFISPGYPQPYHQYSDCYWTIRVGQGSIVKLLFTDIDLEEDRFCSFDFVEVRDGSSYRSPLIGRYCTMSHGFIAINSSSNALWIRFRSDYALSGRGFRAQYITDCNTILRGHRGVIVTPNYPDPYPHDRNCTWTIMAPRGNSINASFSDFVLEDHMDEDNTRCLYDYVDIRERQQVGTGSATIGHYCQGRPTPPPIATGPRRDILEINFVSDYVVAENGFRLEWIINGCGAELTKPSGTFHSPNYPNAYPVNTDCEWYISTAPGTKIQITVHDFDLESADECIYDVLRIYAGEDNTAPLLTSLCHKQRNPTVVTTQGNNAFLSFHSDQTVRGKGFNISYTTIPGGCGGLFTAPKGSIHSPNYPQLYDVHSDCVWVISVDRQHVVELNFTDFDVEPHTNCSYDYVSVYDGNSTDAPMILRHCGDSLPPSVTSTGNSVTLRLKADESMAGRGFIANYTRACGATIDVRLDESGELVSPQYPYLYTPRLNCSWHLQAPEGSRILLHIVHLDINTQLPDSENCTRNYVAAKDGALYDSPELGRYCGHRAPRSITSTAEYLTVTILKDYGHGVGFRAIYSVLTSTCGGELTSLVGELSSPEYPQPYPTSIECIWTIHAGPGNRLQLNFEEFDLEESDGCNLDYLEIHQRDAAGALLLHNCSSASSPMPASVTAEDKMWLKFKSDGTNAGARGFLAAYSLVFGGDLYGDSGEVVSPLYPHIFHSPEDIVWTITVPRGKYVSIVITDMLIEMNPVHDDCYATLVIYDGRDAASGSPLGTYCGNQPPTAPIVSQGRIVTVRFRTMSYFKGSRFRLTYEAVDWRGEPGITPIGQNTNNCSYEIRLNGSYSLQNPGYPGYGHNLDCEWIIQARPHERVSVILFYQLEESYSCQYDRIMVYDGIEGTTNWNMTRRLCRRSQISQRSFVSSGRFLRIRFVTDFAINKTGFTAYLRSVCGGYLRGPEGVISSTNYPNNYRSHEDCEWVIRVGLGKTISLEFDDFRVTNTTPSCDGDYLLIRNGESYSSPYLGVGKFCGMAIPQVPESASNVLRLHFVSDSNNEDKGFKLRYYENSAACGGLHRLTSELPRLQVTSPNYPNPPNPHTECSWTIMAPEEKPISLHFESIDILTFDGACQEAYVEVRDGGTMLSPLLGRFCGRSVPDTQHSTGNALYILYYNNVSTPHAGFKAEANIDSCGGTYNAEGSGIITSPDYPTPYAPDVNCTWKIIAPLGHYLSISFLDVDIDNYGDNCSLPEGRVVIREKNATGEVLGRVCGTADDPVTPTIDTASNIAYITFRGSHNPSRHKGFRFMYNKSVEVCGGDLTGPSGEFTSPGYPHGFSHRRECLWKITVPEGRRVRLDLLDVDLPYETIDFGGYTSYQCSGYLIVQNGPRDGPPFTFRRICGNIGSLPSSFNSSMNIMTVRFFSRAHSASKGFRVRWSSEEPRECGGVLTSTSGQIASPGTHFGGYNHSLYCIWTVSNPNPSNASFVVRVTDLHIERHCFDYIMIEGVTAGGEVVKVQKVCSEYSMAPIVVPYPTLRISFITDLSVNLTGWNLTYGVSPCGGMLHGPQNSLQSPNYPANYPSDVHCAWLLQYGEGIQIDFEFIDFLLENSLNHDYVLVQNGMRLTSPLIGRYTGNQAANLKLRSMTNALVVQFHTDDSGNERGFRAQASTHSRGCGGIYHGMTGNISTQGFPEDYQANLECVWEIDVMVGYHTVVTFLERFDVETSTNCQNDYLQIYHSGQTQPDEAVEWTPDQKLCGKQMPSPYISRGIRVKLLFHSNEAVQGHGFKASWELICGNNYTSDFGFISSPGYPNDYPDDAVCDYRITAPPDAFVRIEFMSFELEDSYGCYYDWLTLTEETRRNRYRPRSWGRYCGTEIPPVITARGPVVISFYSDYAITKSGFYANYTIEACGGNITEPGVIQLPTRPFYHNSMNCIWDITAPDNKVPHLKFELLELESHRQCRYDSISIYDGHVTEDSKLVSRLCGDHSDDLPVVVGKGKLTRVVFRTDGSVTKEGFKAVLEFTHACGENVNISRSGATATIRSLDIDNDGNYEPLLDCQWLIEGLEDQVVTFNFTRLDLEPPGVNDTVPCPYDFVEIRDGPSPDSELIGVYCNASGRPPSVSASSNIMFVRFRSDSYNQRPGFTATLTNTPHPCGASSLEATNQTQVLESPGYPNQYPVSTRCRWIIQSPDETQDIHLEINDMNLESSALCSKDQLYISEYIRTEPGSVSLPIFSGQGTRYPVRIGSHLAYFTYGHRLGHGYCGTSIPHHLTSMTNAVELRFVSDETNTAPGFRLHYSLGNCNRTYNGTSGTIRGGGSASCFSTIVAPEGFFVNIYFSSFNIRSRESECGDNVMKIYDGTHATGEPLMSACGWRRPNPVFSTGNALYISYTPRNYGFFRLVYTTSTQANGCGGSMYVDNMAFLTNPGYPGPAATGLDCIYTIAVAPSQHVAMAFREINLGDPENCNSTYLEVYDIDPSGQSTLFNTVCGSDNVASHLAPSYRMALRYVTGGHNQTGLGWSVSVRPAIPHEDTVFDQTPDNQESTN